MGCRSVFFLGVAFLAGLQPSSTQTQVPNAKFRRLAESFRASTRRSGGELARRHAGVRAALESTRSHAAAWESNVRAGRATGAHLSALRAARAQLAQADRDYGESLRQIEAKLASAGLPEKAAAAREFTAHYRARMDELTAQVEAALDAGQAGNDRAAAALLELIQASFAAREPELHPTSIRTITEEHPPVVAQRQPRPAEDPGTPKPEDLAETKVIQITPEIRAKAAELGNSPIRIYEYVRQNFDFELYFGSMQGSAGVYWSGRGNTDDLANYLVALFRAAKIPAHAAGGRMTVPWADAMNWAGATDKAAAQRILSGAMQVDSGGDTVELDQTWVEAWVDTPDGKGWVLFDPSFKLKQYPPAVRAPWPTFDRMGYFSLPRTRLAGQVYIDQIRDALRKSNPGKAFSDLFYAGQLPLQQRGLLPAGLPYKIAKISYRESTPDPKDHHRIKVEVVEVGTARVLTSADFSLPEMLLEPLAITFGPAGAADAKALAVLGGLEHTPVFAAALVAQIRLGDKIAAAATGGPAIGTSVEVRVACTLAGRTSPLYTATHRLNVGDSGGITISAFQATEPYLGTLIDRALAAPRDPDKSVRDMMHIAGLRFYQRLTAEKRRVYDPLQLRFVVLGPEEALVKSTGEVQAVFDRPFLMTPSRLTLDAGGASGTYRNLNSDTNSGPEFVNVNQANGLTGSSLEHELWEEIVLVPSISATRALQLAAENKYAIKALDKSNVGTELPKMFADLGIYRAPVQQLMQQDTGNGRTVITTDRLLKLGEWKGLGWISEVSSGTGTYTILDLTGITLGGATTSPITQTPQPPIVGGAGDPGRTGGTSCGSPVNVANGNMFHQFVDLALTSPGLPLLLKRTYNSVAPDGPFGYGWTHFLRISLRQDGNSVVMTDGSGGAFAFTPQGSGFAAPPGIRATLSKDSQGYSLRWWSGVQYGFDTGGKLLTITSRNGDSQTFSYDSRGNLAGARDRLGQYLAFTYDASNHVVSLADHTQRQLSYRYDARGNLIESADPAGNKTSYTYYSDRQNDHNLKSITWPNGQTLSFEYYGNDKVSRIITPGGAVMRFFYLPLRNETIMVDERGYATSFQYNGLGEVTRITRPDGNYIDQTWSADGLLLTHTNVTGYTTRHEYDASGNLTRVTDALGNTVQFTYDAAAHDVASVRDSNGNVTRFQYDARGNPTKVTDALGGEFTITWDQRGNPLTLTDAEGHTVSATYDAQDNAVEIRSPLDTLKRAFDNLGRSTSATDAAGGEYRYEYDKRDQSTRLGNPAGETLAYAYDATGNVTAVTVPDGTQERYEYENTGRLARIVDALGNAVAFGHSMEGCGCSSTGVLTSLRNGAGQEWQWRYNWMGQVAEFRDPLGNIASYAYNPLGEVSAIVDRGGQTTVFQYDALSRPVRKVLPGGGEESFTWDANGNLLSMTNPETTVTFTYDALNRVTSVADSRPGTTIRYSYDRIGRRKTMTAPDGGVSTYKYSPRGPLESITNPRGETVRFEYDTLGRRTTTVYPNGMVAESTFDAIGRVLTRAYKDAGGGVVAEWTHTYNKAGLRATVADFAGVHQYRYDDIAQLVGAVHPDLTTEQYTYDAAGNRLSSGGDAYTYDAAGRLLSAGAVTFTYDKRGSIVSRTGPEGTTTYEYDAVPRLTGVSLPDGRKVAYKYDPLGRRIEKSVDGVVTRYVYDHDDVLLEMDGDGQVLATYTHGPTTDEPLLVERGGVTAHFVVDAQGSVVKLPDASGVSETYAYDSFGRPASTSMPAPFAFQAREYDAEAGLYYMRNRYYDPRTGRFLTEDPASFSGGLNLYAFAANTPVNASDPFGLEVRIEYEHTKLQKGYEKDYKMAIDYLRKNEKMAKMINSLEHSSKNVVVTSREAGSGINSYTDAFDPKVNRKSGGRTIHWNPHVVIKLPSGSTVPPVIALAHEIAHASYFVVDKQKASAIWNRYDPQYGTKEERRVITGIEKELMEAIGETPRTDHNSGVEAVVGGPLQTTGKNFKGCMLKDLPR